MSKENLPDKNVGRSEETADQMLWDWKLHEDDLFNNRANFFLVAESMFLTAFSALIVVVGSNNVFNLLPIIMSIAGILICCMWLIIGKIQLKYTDEPLRKMIEERGLGRQYFKEAGDFIQTRKSQSILSISDIMLCIPIVLIAIWGLLLLFYILHFFPALVI